jgi:hypothetical protein
MLIEVRFSLDQTGFINSPTVKNLLSGPLLNVSVQVGRGGLHRFILGQFEELFAVRLDQV